ncbi:hypothetical protein [Methylomicrobium agile]|uniref:hypothetical protein n=1 Tax=Methylomicrobium agile TaxID=39774 RepID=UPI0012F7071A|nr:hypothetical protein [Methylomicrobium agile]
MSNLLKKHRVIGIRHFSRVLKDAGLISEKVMYPSEAVAELKPIKVKADAARRQRNARRDASIPSIIRTIEKILKLPHGSVKIIYPSGRQARSDATVGSLRKQWK